MSPSFQPLGSKITHSGNADDRMRSPRSPGSSGITGLSGSGCQRSRLSSTALVDADAAARHVGDDGGHLHACHRVTAVEVVALGAGQRLAQRGRVVAPVHEVAAGDVLPAREVAFAGRVADLLQVADVIAPLPVQHAIEVVPPPLRRHEVIARPVLVRHQLLAQLVGGHQQVVVTGLSVVSGRRCLRVGVHFPACRRAGLSTH